MTYLLVSIPVLLLTLIVTILASWLRPGARSRLIGSLVAAGALSILTVIFDNIMIAVGLFHYGDGLTSGITLGLAPIEDLLYAVVAAFLVPSVWALSSRPAPKEPLT